LSLYSQLLNRLGLSTNLSQSQSHIATDGQSISKSWCLAPSRAHDQVFITVWLLRSCFYGAPFLTRERVCLLYMLLALASVVFLGSECLGTRDHILLSQIWDFPFLRLLRLSGSRRRYSTPPPYGWGSLFVRVKVKVKVTLRLTVRQSVSLGVEPHLGLMTRYLLLFDSYGLVFVWRPLWREDKSVFCICCWLSPAVFSGPSPLGLATIFYCLSFETSLFVAYTIRQKWGSF
jgi:hypothetical protein